MAAWVPRNIPRFLNMYLGGSTNSELAAEFSTTEDKVKKYISARVKTKDLPTRLEIKEEKIEEKLRLQETMEEEFLKFLEKGRSYEEIEARFGEYSKGLIEDEYENTQVVKQINRLGKEVYIALLKPQVEFVLEEKDWKYHHPRGHIDKQPYLLVNLPENVFDRYYDEEEGCGRIDIVPLFDVHRGHIAHRRDKFEAFIRYIKENDHVYAFLGGDLMENAIDDGRGMSYDQETPPGVQLEEQVEMLAPIAHKILASTPGNHEERTYKKTGVDVARIIANRLEIPYMDGPIYLSLIAGKHKFKFYIFHGRGNSQTKGGKMNAAGRPRRFTDFVHFYVSGHVHDPLVNSETIIKEDEELCRLVYPQQWTVVAPSFLHWEGTYAYRAGYAPPGSGSAVMQLFENGEYRGLQR